VEFAAHTALQVAQVTDDNEEEFKEKYLLCYQTLIKKLKDRSPLKYEFARQLCCLNPQYLVNHPNGSTHKFDGTRVCVINKKFIEPSLCDNIANSFDPC
jgi:hypothetical protein